MVKFDLGSEPERARANRKHQSSGVFVASGERLLMSKQATAQRANVTNRTHRSPSAPPAARRQR